MSKTFDIVLFGVTGYTGQFVLEEMFKRSKSSKFTFAVAGRNSDKITKVLNESAKYTGDDKITNIPIIIADVKDEKSLDDMAKKAKVVLNCVGPYRFYGEAVVKACIENGTHHFDISGEPQYLETMELKYHKQAENNGCYVVGACGFDSIPAEMGVKRMKDIFGGTLNDVEAYINNKSDDNMKIHFGTWESAIYGFAHRKELSSLRKQLFPERLPKSIYPVKKRPLWFFSQDTNKWCLPFPGSDKSIVVRSQNFLHFQKKERPVQFNPYICMPSWIATMFTMLVGGIFGLFSSFKCGRYLLLKFPRLFSFGLVSHEGASRQAIENSKMELMFIGRGWQNKTEVDQCAPNKKVVALITGPECGYVSCSIFLVQSALTTLKEADRMPSSGGVYAPLAAFEETSYFNDLLQNGIQFTTVSETGL